MSEAELIQEARRGNAAAVQALYERYSPRVYAVVRRISGDDDVAQDYSQETWIRAIRALASFRGEARFSTWLHRIAVNTALQAIRKEETRRKRVAPMPRHLAAPVEERDVLLRKRLQWALDQLPPKMRQVLILHEVEGYSHEEIGELMSIATGTSKSQLFKARAKMRELLTTATSSREEGDMEACGI